MTTGRIETVQNRPGFLPYAGTALGWYRLSGLLPKVADLFIEAVPKMPTDVSKQMSSVVPLARAWKDRLKIFNGDTALFQIFPDAKDCYEALGELKAGQITRRSIVEGLDAVVNVIATAIFVAAISATVGAVAAGASAAAVLAAGAGIAAMATPFCVLHDVCSLYLAAKDYTAARENMKQELSDITIRPLYGRPQILSPDNQLDIYRDTMHLHFLKAAKAAAGLVPIALQYGILYSGYQMPQQVRSMIPLAKAVHGVAGSCLAITADLWKSSMPYTVNFSEAI